MTTFATDRDAFRARANTVKKSGSYVDKFLKWPGKYENLYFLTNVFSNPSDDWITWYHCQTNMESGSGTTAIYGYDGPLPSELSWFPLQPDYENDPLYDLIVPYVPEFAKGTGGKPRKVVDEILGVNVWREYNNQRFHNVLMFSRSRGEQLFKHLSSKADEVAANGGTFDLLNTPWKISITGEKNKMALDISRLRVDGGIDTRPAVMDINKFIEKQRADVEAHLESHGIILGAKEDRAYPTETAYAAEESVIRDGLEALAQISTPMGFEDMSTAELRQRIMSAGVSVPAGSTREQLVTIAIEQLPQF
jgi:hypothetical protein